jgi:hypothetical protein
MTKVTKPIAGVKHIKKWIESKQYNGLKQSDWRENTKVWHNGMKVNLNKQENA